MTLHIILNIFCNVKISPAAFVEMTKTSNDYFSSNKNDKCVKALFGILTNSLKMVKLQYRKSLENLARQLHNNKITKFAGRIYVKNVNVKRRKNVYYY